MEKDKESLILEELVYNSRAIMCSFGKFSSKLREIYGNKWLLCAIINGKLTIIKSSDDKSELEELGFKLTSDVNLFDVLNPVISEDYTYKRPHEYVVG